MNLRYSTRIWFFFLGVLFSCSNKKETLLIVLSETAVKLPNSYKKIPREPVGFGEVDVPTSDYRFKISPGEDSIALEVRNENGIYKFILQSGGIQVVNLLDKPVVVEGKYFEIATMSGMTNPYTGKPIPGKQSPYSLESQISRQQNEVLDSTTHSFPLAIIRQGSSRLITTDNKAVVYGLYQQVPDELPRKGSDLPIVFKMHILGRLSK